MDRGAYTNEGVPVGVCCFRQQCFSDVSSRRAADLMSSYATIKTVLHQLYDGLHEVLLKLLRTSDTRESVLQYLGEVIQKNANRSQIQVHFFCGLQVQACLSI